MPAYDFHGLSDADFEDLVGDLLSASLGARFQRFTAGRDDGVDLLLGGLVAEGTVAQCKHYWRSGINKLKANLKNEELRKVAKLRPERYVVATSVGLTPGNKQELLALLSPHCKGLDDIYGCDDLNALLRTHADVEAAHYKLWLTSVPVLRRVLRQGGIVWNALTKSEIERKMSLYVQTGAYEVALGILKKNNYCIISGIPGIGKTTLAQILVTRLLEAGFELIAVRDDVSEAFELLDVNKRQVVYYDDFLGRSSLGERLGKNEDRGILRLLDEAKRSKLLKVIFTTREYILNEAKRLHEPLSGPEVDIAKCVVKVEDYTRRHRARILYNHVYFSNLSVEYAAALVKDRAYRAIVDHANYNPRIIEWMTSDTGAQAIPADQFVDTFVRTLDNPLRIWEHAFENQIGEDGQLLLLCLASIVGTIGVDELRMAWMAARSPEDGHNITRSDRDRFNAALKQLEGSFVQTERGHHETGVSFHNPSIRDYVARRVSGDKDLRLEMLARAPFFEQVSCLIHLDYNGHVQDRPTRDVYDGELLRAAIQRTITARSPILGPVSYGKGEPRLGRWSWRAGFGDRLSKMAGWADVFGADWLEITCGVASVLTETSDIAKVATTEACGFLESVIHRWGPEGGKWSPLMRRFISEIGNGIIADGGSSDEWTEWSSFVERHLEFFADDALKDWSDRAYEFCTNEVDLICGNAESASETEDQFWSVREIGKAWGFSLDAEERRIEKKIADLESRERGDEDWERGGSRSRAEPTPAATDEELDGLFRSLSDRDRP